MIEYTFDLSIKLTLGRTFQMRRRVERRRRGVPAAVFRKSFGRTPRRGRRGRRGRMTFSVRRTFSAARFLSRALFELWARFQMFWRAQGGDFIKWQLSEIELETANNIKGAVA